MRRMDAACCRTRLYIIATLFCLLQHGIVTTMAEEEGHWHRRGQKLSASAQPPSWMCPEKCTCSKSGASVNCEGRRLTSIPEGIPPLVETLYLDHNNFVVLKENSLVNLTHLTKVYLRNNQIQTLKAGAFRDLPLLRELYLTNNYIVHLLPDAFQGVDTLSLLNLQANKMTSIPDLPTLPGLKKLYLEANQIQNATFPAGYSKLKFLNSVVLSNNNISQLHNKTFTALNGSSVRRLEIARNGLKNVSTGALEPLKSLQSLKIGWNPLDGQQLQHVLEGLSEDSNLESLDIRSIALGGALPKFSFSVLSATPLRTLIFNHNVVRRIPTKAFADLPKLTQLDLAACHVQEVADDAFVELPNLQVLFLNDNLGISSVPQNLPGSLLRLYFQNNRIQTLSDGDFKNLGQLQELYLSDNKIHEVSENSFMGLASLRILHLQNNQLSYIPKKLFIPLTSLRTLILKNNNLKSLKPNPGAMSSLAALTFLDMSGNLCSYIPFDYFSDLTSLQTLNLHNNDLGGLLAADSAGRLLSSMRKLQNLDLSNNNLHYIHDAQFRNLFELVHLKLQNNQLSSWGPQLFYTPGTAKKSLKTLDLSSNQIALVNKTSVHDLHHLQTLNLSLNPFACTCDLRWFRTWLNNTTVNVVSKTMYKCNSPAAWNGRPLLEFGPDKIDCTDYTWYYVGGAIAVTFVIALIVFSIIYRRRWFIRLRLYRLQKAVKGTFGGGRRHGRREGYQPIDAENMPGVRYDFYVIYAPDDLRWVVDNFMPVLDNGPTLHDRNQKYPGSFTLYMPERDDMPNRSTIANFEESIPACRAALIVLTPNLSSDAWCMFLVDQVYFLHAERELDRIQIIKVGNVPTNRIPRRLHQDMTKNQHRDWLDRDNVEQEFVNFLENALQQGQGRRYGAIGEEAEAPVV